MKVCVIKTMLIALCAIALPLVSHAQVADKIAGLNGVLDKLFDEMMPLCSRMIDVGRALAGFAALFYIGTRVWKHIAKAESIDFYPLLRPFAIGIAILLFPSVIALINGVLKPTVTATAAMSKDSNKAIQWHIDQQEKAITEGTPAGGIAADNNGMEKYDQPSGSDNHSGGLFSAFSFFNLKNAFELLIRDFFNVLYNAAALCINTVRTFYLIVLAILGPLIFGLSVFEGFQHTLSSWFARYINVYMWLPVANIFGAITAKILENMITLDQDFFSSTAYIVFMVIAVIGYTTVPSIANYIVHAAGGNNSLLDKINKSAQSAGTATANAAAAMI